MSATVQPDGLGQWIKKNRLGAGLSLRELADLAGIAHSSLDKAERGGGVRDSTLGLIVRALAGDQASEEEVTALLQKAKAARAGIDLPPMDRIPTDEEWELVQGFRGLTGTQKHYAKGLILSSVEVTGDEPKEELVFGRGPIKPPK